MRCFFWRCGEPRLPRRAFFHKVVELEQKYKKSHQRIENDFQANGIGRRVGAFVKKHNFLLGLSIAGPKELHDGVVCWMANQRLRRCLPQPKC